MVLVCRVLGSDAGQGVDAAVAEAVAGAFEGEDVGVVHMRSIIAAATACPPNTPPQPLKGRFDLRVSEACSSRDDTSWKNSSASCSKGR